ncbi:hypothetical protein [Streptomyces sp. NPDC054863]
MTLAPTQPAPAPSDITVAYVADEDADGVRVRVYDPTGGSGGARLSPAAPSS